MDDRSVAQIAPSGAFFVTDTLGCGNPFLSPQQFEALCGRYGLTADDTQTVYVGRRNVEGGNRQDDLRHTSFRGVLGVRGDFTDDWRYDLYYQYAEVRMQEAYLNELSTSRIRRSLDAVRHPETGRVACRSVVDGSDPACVPWNIFREGAVTQEMVDYLTLPLFARRQAPTRPSCPATSPAISASTASGRPTPRPVSTWWWAANTAPRTWRTNPTRPTAAATAPARAAPASPSAAAST